MNKLFQKRLTKASRVITKSENEIARFVKHRLEEKDSIAWMKEPDSIYFEYEMYTEKYGIIVLEFQRNMLFEDKVYSYIINCKDLEYRFVPAVHFVADSIVVETYIPDDIDDGGLNTILIETVSLI